MKILLSKKADSALNKKSDRPFRAFQMSDISLLAMSRTYLHLSRTKMTSDVSRPVRAVSDFFFLSYNLFFHLMMAFFQLGRDSSFPVEWNHY